MTIKNIMSKTNQISNFAVCCTTPLPISVINPFLTQVHHQENEESTIPILTLVHDLEATLWGPTKQLVNTDNDTDTDTLESDVVLQSPFLDCDFLGIQGRLQRMVRITNSPLNTSWFLVLDDRSEKDSTAVIVHVEEGIVRQVRVAYAVSSRYLSAASIGHPPLDELMEIAEEEGGGVLRD